MSRSSNDVRRRSWSAPARAGSTRARSRSSTSAGSPTGSSPRDRSRRRCASANTTLDLSDFPTRHPYSLGLWQNHIERIMLGWVEELGVPVRRGVEVTGFAQDETGVDVHLAEGDPLRTTYLVGADGGRSVVRKAAGIDFVGWDATRSHLIAEVEVDRGAAAGDPLRRHRDPWPAADGRRADRAGAGDRARARVRPPSRRSPTSPRRCGSCTARTSGSTVRPGSRRFTDATRQAAAYRAGRVLIAGDAAHIHHPSGGQGIGLGVQDAVNLGWKLAQVVKGISPDGLLDTYHAERHPVEARALKHTMAQSVVQRADVRIEALRDDVRRPAGLRRAAQAGRGSRLRARRRLRPRRGAPAARTTHARPRPGHGRRPDPGLHAAARGQARAARPR